jgi:hypothetical protein
MTSEVPSVELSSRTRISRSSHPVWATSDAIGGPMRCASFRAGMSTETRSVTRGGFAAAIGSSRALRAIRYAMRTARAVPAASTTVAATLPNFILTPWSDRRLSPPAPPYPDLHDR